MPYYKIVGNLSQYNSKNGKECAGVLLPINESGKDFLFSLCPLSLSLFVQQVCPLNSISYTPKR